MRGQRMDIYIVICDSDSDNDNNFNIIIMVVTLQAILDLYSAFYTRRNFQNSREKYTLDSVFNINKLCGRLHPLLLYHNCYHHHILQYISIL